MALLNLTIFSHLFRSLKRHIHHFIFALTILSLAALITWWAVFIRNSIRAQHSTQLEKLRFEMEYRSKELGNQENSPIPGVLQNDDRFEVFKCTANDQSMVFRLEPRWPDLCLRPRKTVLEQIENKYSRLNFMLIGEGSFFVLIILVSSFFLYRFIQLERRTALEVKRFWERSAHEIKTPITGIKAFLQNLKSHAYNAEELAPYVDLALKQVANQEQLANNIMSGYHLRSKDISVKSIDLELKEFLGQYFDNSPLQFTDSQIHLKFQTSGKIHVKADPSNLKIVLDNIIDNAIKYCLPDLVLAVDITSGKKRAVVSISDNGPGIPPEKANNVFSAFKHPDEELPVKRRGAGFGMYISRRLVHQMGGDFQIISKGVGKGSEFLIHLDLVS
jgi:signal transduction histidine kinase